MTYSLLGREVKSPSPEEMEGSDKQTRLYFRRCSVRLCLDYYLFVEGFIRSIHIRISNYKGYVKFYRFYRVLLYNSIVLEKCINRDP